VYTIFQLAVAFCATVVLLRLFVRAAKHFSLVDVPYGRKAHQGVVPLVGGIAMFAAFIFTVFLSREPLTAFNSLLSGLVLLIVVGVLDDLHDLSANSRLVAQLVAALLVTSWGGVTVHELGNLFGSGSTTLGSWSIVFTVVCIIGTINAINMTDGIDGLAGTIVLFAAVTFAMLAQSAGLFRHATMLFVLSGVLAGFLTFNLRTPWRKQAAVFMGDSGSMMLGFALAWFAIDLSSPQRAALAPMTAVWIIGLPLMDMASVMARRIARGSSPFRADSQHLHHLLQRVGYPVSVVTVMVVSANLVLGLGAIAAEKMQVPAYFMFYGFMVLLFAYHFGSRHAWRRLERRAVPSRPVGRASKPEPIVPP